MAKINSKNLLKGLRVGKHGTSKVKTQQCSKEERKVKGPCSKTPSLEANQSPSVCILR